MKRRDATAKTDRERLNDAFYAIGKRRGRAANQFAQSAAVVKQSAFRRAGIGIRQHIGKPGRQADVFQRGGEIGFDSPLL